MRRLAVAGFVPVHSCGAAADLPVFRLTAFPCAGPCKIFDQRFSEAAGLLLSMRVFLRFRPRIIRRETEMNFAELIPQGEL